LAARGKSSEIALTANAAMVEGLHVTVTTTHAEAPQRARWFVERMGGARGDVALICFSHAGGGAAQFHAWQHLVGPNLHVVAVQLPGRGGRFREALVKSLALAADAIASALCAREMSRFALFGHSLGGLLAFEVARRCIRHFARRPEHLFVAGATPPPCVCDVERISHLSDADLLGAVVDMNGLPADISSTERQTAELMLPTLRADLALEETYTYESDDQFDVPITSLAGNADAVVPPQIMQRWDSVTRGTCRTVTFDGDHFFVEAKRDALIALIRAELAADRIGTGHAI
jgi:surfactin synthase thioesterase subunit